MQFLSRFARNRGALVGAAVIVGLLLVALLAPMLTPHDPTAMNPAHRLQAPGKDYPLGTDQFGRDQLTRLLYGARTSLSIGLVTTGIAATFGIALGVLAGFVGGAVDRAVTMLMDIVFSFPAILLAVAIVAMLGPSLPNVMIAIGIVNIPVFGRIVRAAALSVSSMTYVEAAVALGNRRWAIVFRHILPNVLAPIMVQASLTFAFAILSATIGLCIRGCNKAAYTCRSISAGAGSTEPTGTARGCWETSKTCLMILLRRPNT